MAGLTMYTTQWCGYCVRLKAQLDRAGVGYREVDIEADDDAADYVASINSGNRTVPTLRLPDGTVATNPRASWVVAQMAALASVEEKAG